MIEVLPSEHSELGASSAHRWMPCPGSIPLSRGLLNEETEHAALGTAAHEISERALKEKRDAADFRGETVKVGKFTFEVDDDMIEAVTVYVDFIRELMVRDGAEMHIETQFHLSDLDARFFGRNDAIVYLSKSRCLYVIDYKHGAGVKVHAEENAQLKYYALGALYAFDKPVETIKLVIVQPRAAGEPIDRWPTDCMAIMEFGAELVDAAKRVDAPNAPRVIGEHCRFCPAAAICPEREREAYDAANALFDDIGGMELPVAPHNVTPSQMAVVMERAKRIEDWVNAVMAFAHAEAEQGRTPDGYKLADKQARRAWLDDLDEDEIASSLEMKGVDPEDLYVRKLGSPKLAEERFVAAVWDGKRGGKKKAIEEFNQLFDGKLFEKKSSGTVLVPNDDPRPAVGGKRNPDELFD